MLARYLLSVQRRFRRILELITRQHYGDAAVEARKGMEEAKDARRRYSDE